MTEKKTPPALQSVTEKVVKAAPEIAIRCENGFTGVCDTCGQQSPAFITLEDVLRAAQKIGLYVDAKGNLAHPFSSAGIIGSGKQWTLGKPLSQQSEETLLFLDQLL